VKTRSIAGDVVGRGKVRVNGRRVTKPAYSVSEGDVLTLNYARQVRLIRVTGFAKRRGSPATAQSLYLDLDAGPDT
jgi:ribosome-associated heat shock protein Hsp15